MQNYQVLACLLTMKIYFYALAVADIS